MHNYDSVVSFTIVAPKLLTIQNTFMTELNLKLSKSRKTNQ